MSTRASPGISIFNTRQQPIPINLQRAPGMSKERNESQSLKATVEELIADLQYAPDPVRGIQRLSRLLEMSNRRVRRVQIISGLAWVMGFNVGLVIAWHGRPIPASMLLGSSLLAGLACMAFIFLEFRSR